ncbi:N-methyl-L-tryptophan oxidase [Saccharothrix violaceirubra]
MGSAAAWQLAVRGFEVVLLERFSPGHAFGASHGASRIFRLVYGDPLYVGLALEASALWRELGGDVLTETGGVDHGDLTGLAESLEAAGSPGRLITADEARARWPGLRFDTDVFFHPRTGRLHADNAVTKLQEAATYHGAVVRHQEPALSIKLGDKVEVRTAQDVYRARRVVVAVGAWTTRLLGDLVPLPPLRVTQEQPAHFRPLHPGDWPAFIHRVPDGVYGMATPGEGIKVGHHGSGPEVDPDRRDFTAEPGRFRALRDYVRQWLPGVDADAATPISCTYTSTPNSDFVLDRYGPLVVAAGFSGHGFKFVPAIGRVLADLATSDALADPRFRLSIPAGQGNS